MFLGLDTRDEKHGYLPPAQLRRLGMAENQTPHFEDLLGDLISLTTASWQRIGQQALGAWNQAAQGEYEPKHLLRDATAFWAGLAKDSSKAFVAVRDFLIASAANDQQPGPDE